MPEMEFRLGLELTVYLDGNISGDGPDDPTLLISKFHMPWWEGESMPPKSMFLNSITVRPALEYHRSQLEKDRPIVTSRQQKTVAVPNYTWHPEADADAECNKCPLYRAVSFGHADRMGDIVNMVCALETANRAERNLAIRRASGFNELFAAVLKKECDEGESASGETGTGQSAREKFGSSETRSYRPTTSWTSRGQTMTVNRRSTIRSVRLRSW